MNGRSAGGHWLFMMIRRTLLVAACLPFSVFVTGCDIFAIEGDGHVVSVTRTVAPFTEVSAESSLDVEVRQGSAFEVEVRLDRNLVDRVSTRVEDGRLVIDSDEGLDSHVRGAKVIVTMPKLDRAVLGGSGQLTIDSWDGEGPIVLVLSGSGDLGFDGEAPEVSASLDGSGDCRLRGRAETVDLHLSGSGDLDAEELSVSRATLRLSGSGDLAANVDGPVDIDLSGSGDVEVFGRPRIEREAKSGSGDVTFRQ
jgi:hypothetical protein